MRIAHTRFRVGKSQIRSRFRFHDENRESAVNDILAAGSLIVVLLQGACLLFWLARGRLLLGLPEYLAWSYVIGVGALTILLPIAGTIAPFHFLPLIVTGFIVIAAAATWRLAG